ncbi:hypothetical protein [Terriglobus aquaticus]|uniref:DUF1425 domain-containing protein n=1 Tax=Terriglobus aquaticus TaxID=940139 RepID=A0ABW9KJV4_9BACT|nr:hypothetical protein [Terriglobus aquaticus]
MRFLFVAVLCGSLALAGCRSRYVEASVTNASGSPLHTVQVAYPSASFGTQDLADGQTFRYRFKVIGSGPIKLDFTDAKMQEHLQTGPALNEGDEGSLSIRFPAQDRAEFQVNVHGH